MSDFAPYTVRKAVGGTAFDFIIGDKVAQLWYDELRGPQVQPGESEGFVPDRAQTVGWPEMDILREHIALPGSRMVECGSHHGFTTVLFAAWIGPEGFVYAFDAVLDNVRVVKQNILANGIGNAAAYCAAISGDFGILEMYHESNVVTRPVDRPSLNSTLAVRVSAFFPFVPDAIKIDIEGAELAMVEAEREWLARIPRLAMEVHTDYLPEGGVDRLIAALGDRPLFILPENGDLRPYAGEAVTERVHLFSW